MTPLAVRGIARQQPMHLSLGAKRANVNGKSEWGPIRSLVLDALALFSQLYGLRTRDRGRVPGDQEGLLALSVCRRTFLPQVKFSHRASMRACGKTAGCMWEAKIGGDYRTAGVMRFCRIKRIHCCWLFPASNDADVHSSSAHSPTVVDGERRYY